MYIDETLVDMATLCGAYTEHETATNADATPKDGLTVRFCPLPLEESSPLSGELSYSIDAQHDAQSGAQGSVIMIRDGEGHPYALKRFHIAQQSAALTEFQALVAYSEFRLLPKPYWLGTACITSGPDTGANTTGVPCPAIVMEWIDGVCLDSLLKTNGRLSIEAALAIIKPVVRFCTTALEDTRHGLAHRDIKPGNIIVQQTEGGVFRTRLIDLGISASALGEDNSNARGTRGYAPPEQFFGMSATSPQDDAYSIAATVLQTLTGTRPPAYGVKLSPEGDLAYDQDWDDERENELAIKCGLRLMPSPRAMGIYLSPKELGAAFLHEEHVASELYGKLSRKIIKTCGVSPEEDKLHRAMRESYRLSDMKLKSALAMFLSAEPAERASLQTMERQLPLDADGYQNELLIVAQSIYLGGSLSPSRTTNDAETPTEEFSFEKAYELYNGGFYEQCIPLFEHHALRGNYSAMYNLAVMIRSHLGGTDKRYSMTDCAQLMAGAAEAGNILAQNAYGQMLFNGEGVPQNQELGLSYIRRSAQDDPSEGKTGFVIAKKWLEDNGFGC